MAIIHPILLCGGSGQRLWPLSRKSYPKQFAKLAGNETLFQSSALRLTGDDFAAPIVLTASDYRFIVTQQLQSVGIDPGAIMIEPEGRNTAPAILAAALYLETQDPNALMLVTATDHVIPDSAAFRACVQLGVEAAEQGNLVTFGIKPDRPETGYGYLEIDDIAGDSVVPLKRFVEKPDLAKAEEMLASNSYLWNAGIFLFSVNSILKSFQIHAPQMLETVAKAVDKAKPDLGFLRLDPESWEMVEKISIDYAIMEKADNLSVVPFAGIWSDLGGWDAVWRQADQDENGVVCSEYATAIDCENTLLRSENSEQEIVGLGLNNIIAIAMPDAVLVADISRSPDVGSVVHALIQKGAKQAETLPRDNRPWGWFESLSVGERFQVKRIMVHPNGALSLQSHLHRSEHWIVVAGTATVTIAGVEQTVTENQSVYIPLGEVHRLANNGKVELHLIEVQTGAYLGEDDIVRYEDIYARKEDNLSAS
ncbi:MAG: mannose-1-phosphate guanylyltransferase/mannose-6-phosphate isomerase [Rhizobiaceae bacterium]|nr:mannose-1-phosphate guanylyltransferase/mannose-6-phosphate isomerase [Rhizobiaceae bacterium]